MAKIVSELMRSA